jgi:hypothetical protein
VPVPCVEYAMDETIKAVNRQLSTEKADLPNGSGSLYDVLANRNF